MEPEVENDVGSDARRAEVKPRKRWRKRLAAAALGLGVPLLVLEIGVRVRHGDPLPQKLPLQLVEANELRGWQLVPDRDFYTFDRKASINSLGLRGPEVAPRSDGELRVVALGDSLVFGVGVDDDETLPAALERELESRLARPCTVVNTGHSAYATNQELGLLYELGPQLDADVVVLFWFFNDISEPPREATWKRLLDSGPITFETENDFSGWPALRWRALEFLRRSALCAYALWQHDYRRHGTWTDEFIDAGFERLEVYLDNFQTLCDASGAKLCVVVLPFSVTLGRSGQSIGMEQRAAAYFRAQGVPVLETRPALEAALPRLGRIPHVRYDYHYDASGNQVQAEAVAEWLAPIVQSIAAARPGE